MSASDLNALIANRPLLRIAQLSAVMMGLCFALAFTMFELAAWSVGR